MFLGHFAVGLGAKRAAPAVSLGWLFLACQLADLLWPTLVLVGTERLAIDPGNTAFTPLHFESYPYSHSLASLALWGALAALIYRRASGASPRAAVVVAAVVVSHWVLDVVTHRPDVPLAPWGTTKVGLGMWNSVPATVVVEAAMLAAGLWLYTRTTRANDRIGSVGFWALIGLLLLINIANIAGPVPGSATNVAWSAQGLWLIVVWAFWVDRHRSRSPAG